MVALKHFRRPEVEVIGDEVTVVSRLHYPPNPFPDFLQHSPLERAPVALAIHHSPYCFTFAFFNDPAIPPILDPSQLEYQLSAGLVSIALNAQKELCVLQKLGGVPLGAQEVIDLVEIVVAKAKEVHELVEKRLQEDWKSRVVEVR